VREQALRRGHRIVQAATELVAEGGLESVTLRALLDKTGLARRAFYSHFRSMDDVLLAVFEDAMAAGAARFREDSERLVDPVAALEHVVRTTATAALSSSDRVYMLAMTQQHVRLAQHRPDELNAAHAPMTDLYADLLRTGMEKGVVRQADPRALAELIQGLISTQIHRNLHRVAEDAKWVDDLWEFVRSGIGASGGRG